MKRLFCKIGAILRGARGETLMEGIISNLVFTVLVASITMMILTSLRISSMATDDAGRWRLEANGVLSGDDAFLDGPDEVVLTISGVGAGTISIPVDVYVSDRFTAFEP